MSLENSKSISFKSGTFGKKKEQGDKEGYIKGSGRGGKGYGEFFLLFLKM